MGAVLGAALHLGVKAPGLVHYGFRWWPVLDLRSHAVRRVGWLVLPRVLDLGVYQLTVLITTNLASRLGHGSVSALEWGWGAMQLPETVIGTAFGLVAFPTMAELAARRDLPGLRCTLAETLRLVLVLTVPATCALILLGRPFLQVLYQRGAFDASATDAVTVALRFYAVGLVAQSALELAARAFFAQQDMVTPLFVAIGSAAANILLALLLMGALSYGGLALSNSLAVSGEVLVLLYILARRLGGLGGRQILSTLVRVLVATACMSATIAAATAWAAERGIGALGMVIVGGGLGVLVYLGVALLLRIGDLTRLPATLLERR
jgi:putative peptidoglycan lipid II flippase